MSGIKKVSYFYINWLIEKYCKFKAVDIFKSLKAGVVPKRGGPKEEEDEISKAQNDVKIDNNKMIENSTNVKSENNLPSNLTTNPPTNNFTSYNNNLTSINNIPSSFDPDIIDINRMHNSSSLDLKKETSFDMLDPNFKVDGKLHKKPDFKLPVKYKSIDYFRLCDVLKKQLENSIA